MIIQEAKIVKKIAGVIGSIASVASEVEAMAEECMSDKGSVVINEAIKLVEYRRLDSGDTTGESRVADCLGVLRELRRELSIEEQADRDEDEPNNAPAYAGV